MKTRFPKASVLLALCASFCALGTHASEFGAWSHRVRITFPGYTRTMPLTNYVALVTFSEGAPAGFSFADTLSNGNDLRFADPATGATLAHEIDGAWGSGTAHVWVHVPRFTGTTAIRAYWGKPDATAPDYTSNGAVWTNLFKAVWHMQSGPNPTDSAKFPSTHNGVDVGTDGIAETAKIGNGLRYNGLGRVTIQNSTQLEGTDDTTWMFWYYKRGTGGGMYGTVLGGGSDYNNGVRHLGSDPIGWRIASATPAVTTPSLANEAWHFLAFRYANAAKANVWIGGANAVTGTVTVSASLDLNLLIGISTSGDDRAPNGTVDEIRVARTRLSDDWLWATWKNTDAPATFVAFEAVEPGSVIRLH